MQTKRQQIAAVSTSLRVELSRKALGWCQSNSESYSTLGDAITKYLAKLDPYSTEWSDWIDVYGEGKLIAYFGVDDI